VGAIGASESNFIGDSAGYQATGASESNFIGDAAGQGASLASYSNLFGYQSGRSFPVDTPTNNIGSNNIIIGTNISLPNATANAMNLGGVLFATGTHSNPNGDPSITAVSGGKVGIGVVSPSYTLQVGNSSISGVVARFENSVGTCDINPTTSSVGCSSDIRLKKNITTLDNTEFALSTVPDMTGKSTLEKVLNLTPVTYNWNSENDTDQKHIGFIAQEMEQIFPDLVSTDPVTGLKSLSYANLTPYLAKAIQEMDLKITDINNQELENSWRDSILAWFKNTSNGITEFIANILRAKDKLCIGEGSDEVCITKEDLLQMKNNAGLNAGTVAELPAVDNPGSSGTDNSTAGTSDTSGAGASDTGTTTDTTGTTGGNDGNNTDTTGGNTNNTTTDTSTTNTPDTGTTNINAGNDTTGNTSGDTTNTDTTNTNSNNSGANNQNNDLGN
jgi:hypothetical protein